MERRVFDLSFTIIPRHSLNAALIDVASVDVTAARFGKRRDYATSRHVISHSTEPTVGALKLFKTGQLVRYLETGSRWYFARVQGIRTNEIELAFFDGSPRVFVPISQVETFDAFLGQRERKFSRTRSQLTGFFYGREFQRLPKPRLRKMQKTLRSAGISFYPEEWPKADTRIQLWLDGSFVQRDGAAPELEALLPQWLEPFVLPSGSRDPLGLQAPAERLVNEVLPGLTVFTYRAGYYGFLTWAIRSVNGLSSGELPRYMSRREAMNALERALVLSEFVYHDVADESCRLIGQRSKLRLLSSKEGDLYRVPDSILKNQNSAGSFRLFATSLVSLDLVKESPEFAADGLLPFRLTPLGDGLARAFQTRVHADFIPFSMRKGRQGRKSLRAWGKHLCFSQIARRATYRKSLLQGLLLGNSHYAEKRYRTVAHLFAQGLFQSNKRVAVAPESLNEEDAAVLEEDVQGTGLSNLDVVLRFYSCAPRSDLVPLQSLAVFELLSLGLSSIFRAAVHSVTAAGQADIGGLTRSIASAGTAELWQTPMRDAKPKTVRKLVADLFNNNDPIQAAALGGTLLLRVIRDPILPAVWDNLFQLVREPVELVDRCLRQRMELPLADALPEFFQAMVERHEFVSQRKNRQRWLFVDGDSIIRDDPQTMGLGLHSLRFPQLGSIARDIDLREEDLRDG